MDERWPALPYDEWKATRDTLHRYAQIVGKVQLALTPKRNHYWNVAFHLTAHGWSTPPLAHPKGVFEIAFDFVSHAAVIRTSDGAARTIPFGVPVADFYWALMRDLGALGIRVHIRDRPVEIPN